MKSRKIAQSMRGLLSLISLLPGFSDDRLPDKIQHRVIKDALEKQSTFVIREFDQLAKFLQQLADRGGGSVFRDFYRDRYRDIVKPMEILQFTFKSQQFWIHGTKFTETADNRV